MTPANVTPQYFGIPVIEVIQPATRRALREPATTKDRRDCDGRRPSPPRLRGRLRDCPPAARCTQWPAALRGFVEKRQPHLRPQAPLETARQYYSRPLKDAGVDTLVSDAPTTRCWRRDFLHHGRGHVTPLFPPADETAKDVYRELLQPTPSSPVPEEHHPHHRVPRHRRVRDLRGWRAASSAPRSQRSPHQIRGQAFPDRLLLPSPRDAGAHRNITLDEDVAEARRPRRLEESRMRLTIISCTGFLPRPPSPAICYMLTRPTTGRTWRVIVDMGNGSLGSSLRPPYRPERYRRDSHLTTAPDPHHRPVRSARGLVGSARLAQRDVFRSTARPPLTSTCRRPTA